MKNEGGGSSSSASVIPPHSFDEELLFAILVMLCVVAGMVINTASLYSLHKYNSSFHRFLKMLAVFDVLVVGCCLWMYSLPTLSSTFKQVSNWQKSMIDGGVQSLRVAGIFMTRIMIICIDADSTNPHLPL